MAIPPLIVLRPSQQSCATASPDPYSSFPHLFKPYFFPLLTTTFHYDKLVEIIQSATADDDHMFDGIVISSARGGEGWVGAWKKVLEALGDEGEGWSRLRKKWEKIPFFSIGDTTTASLDPPESCSYPQSGGSGFSGSGSSSSSATQYSLQPTPRPFYPSPSSIRTLQGSSSTQNFAPFISSFFPDAPTSPSPPKLLHITGDKTPTLLENLLSESNIRLVTLRIYETSPSPGLSHRLSILLNTPSSDLHRSSAPTTVLSQNPFILLSSPSTTQIILPLLRDLNVDLSLNQVRLIAIGPTTQTYVDEKESDVELVGTAATTNAGGVADVVRKILAGLYE